MAIELISKIKPKNNGDFKLVVDTLTYLHRGGRCSASHVVEDVRHGVE